MAGNGTIGLELVEQLDDIDAVLIPWGGGGLSTGIASALHALTPDTKVYVCEPEIGRAGRPPRSRTAASRSRSTSRRRSSTAPARAASCRRCGSTRSRSSAASFAISLEDTAATRAAAARARAHRRRGRRGSAGRGSAGRARGSGPRRLHRLRREHRRRAARRDPRRPRPGLVDERSLERRRRASRSRLACPTSWAYAREHRAEVIASTRARRSCSSSIGPYSAKNPLAPVRREAGTRRATRSMRRVPTQTSPQSMTRSERTARRRARDAGGGRRARARASPDGGGSASAAARMLLDGAPAVARASSSRGRARCSRAAARGTAMSARRFGVDRQRALGSTAARVAVVQHAEEAAELRRRARLARLGEARHPPARRPGSSGAPKNGHGKRSLGRADELAARDGTGSSGASRGSTASSRSTPRNRDRATREAERPLLVDDPDRVVPALAEEPRRARVELRELLGEERAHERLVDRDLCIPLGHRATVRLGSRRPLRSCAACTGSSRSLALILLGFAAISARVEGTPVTAPMVFTAAGLVFGVEALDLVDPSATGVEVKVLAEATLAVVLFSDASRIDLRALRADARHSGAAARESGFRSRCSRDSSSRSRSSATSRGRRRSCSRSSSRPPTRRWARLSSRCAALPLRVRQSLNVESRPQRRDLRSAVPDRPGGRPGRGGRDRARRRGRARRREDRVRHPGRRARRRCGGRRRRLRGGSPARRRPWLQIVPLAGAGLAFGFAEAIGGSGFIAAFVGGMVFGGLRRHRGADVSYLMEQAGAVLAAVTFVVFGAVLLGPALRDLSWEIALYAVLSLTLIRMLPVAHRDGRHRRAPPDGGVPRLVRSAWRRLDRLRAADRSRRAASRTTS